MRSVKQPHLQALSMKEPPWPTQAKKGWAAAVSLKRVGKIMKIAPMFPY
jgi:hypothetical protein